MFGPVQGMNKLFGGMAFGAGQLPANLSMGPLSGLNTPGTGVPNSTMQFLNPDFASTGLFTPVTAPTTSPGAQQFLNPNFASTGLFSPVVAQPIQQTGWQNTGMGVNTGQIGQIGNMGTMTNFVTGVMDSIAKLPSLMGQRTASGGGGMAGFGVLPPGLMGGTGNTGGASGHPFQNANLGSGGGMNSLWQLAQASNNLPQPRERRDDEDGSGGRDGMGEGRTGTERPREERRDRPSGSPPPEQNPISPSGGGGSDKGLKAMEWASNPAFRDASESEMEAATGTQYANGLWCADFVSSAFESAGGLPGGKTSSTSELRNRYEAAAGGADNGYEAISPDTMPKPGDIVVWNGGSKGHTGIVTGVRQEANGSYSIKTIEGNSGDKVTAHDWRSKDQIAQQSRGPLIGFLRVK